jgi:hypothetical protein
MSNTHQRIEAIAPLSAEQGRVSSSSETSEDRREGGVGGSFSTNSESNLNHKAYQDCSKLPPAAQKEKAETTPSQAPRDPTFPVKLHMILSNPAHEGTLLSGVVV